VIQGSSPSRALGFPDLVAVAVLLLLVAWYVVTCVDLGRRPEEDAAMLLRYSSHVATGYGIVWNAGEQPVEGATDFLFMVAVAAAHRLRASLEGAAQTLGLVSHLLTAIIIYLGARRLFAASWALALVPSVFFGLGPGLRHVAACYATPFFTLWAALAWLIALHLADVPQVRTRTAFAFGVAALGLGLSRPEGVFLGGFMMAAVLAVRRGRDARSLLVPYAAVFLTAGLAYFLWRWHYFGYPLPNPFYAKGAGILHWYSFRRAWRDLGRLGLPFVDFLPLALLWRGSRRAAVLALIPVVGFVCLWVLISDEANYVMRLRAPLLPIVLLSWVAVWQAFVPALPPLPPAAASALGLLAAAAAGLWQHHQGRFVALPRMGLYDAAVMLSQYEPREFCLVTTEAGLLPLYSRWRAVDAWGLNDPWIAHHGAISEEYLDRFRPEVIVFHAYFSPGTPDFGPHVENRALGPRWYRMVMTLKRYAESRGYVRAAVFGRNPFDTHWYFVRSGFPQSAEIVARLRAIDYWWDGEPTVDFRDADREPVLPPASAGELEKRTHAHATVHGEAGPRDPARGGRGQEETGVGHVLGTAQAPEGGRALPASHPVRPGLLDALAPDEPGSHRVHADAQGP